MLFINVIWGGACAGAVFRGGIKGLENKSLFTINLRCSDKFEVNCGTDETSCVVLFELGFLKLNLNVKAGPVVFSCSFVIELVRPAPVLNLKAPSF